MPTSDPGETQSVLALPLPSTDIISLADKEGPKDYSKAGSEVRIPALYGALEVNGVPQAIVNGFCLAVERAVSKDTTAVGMLLLL